MIRAGGDGIAATAAAVARVLVWFYPPAFRRDHGGDLTRDVQRRAGDLRRVHGGIRAAFWIVRLAISLFINAAGAWVESVRGRPSAPRALTFSLLDLKLAIRMLAKYPGLTVTGGLGIAVAVALGVGFFALFHSRFYPEIPLSGGDRVVALENWDARTGREERRALHDFLVWRSELKTVEDITAFRTVTRNVIAGDGSVDLVEVAEITPSGFRLARVPPLMGRSLLEQDVAPGAPPVIVIGFDVWRSRFASAHDIVGRDIRLGAIVHTIVGVMPESFAFPVNHRFWVPLKVDPAAFKRGEGPALFVSARLAPGIDIEAANAEVAVIGRRMAADFPETHGQLRPEVLPYTYQFAGMSRTSSDGFWPMIVLASLLLVVVCVNVAILVYARTATRIGEIAVRSALGASRARIVAQLFAESLVLSTVASAVGVAVVLLAFDWARSVMAGVGDATFWEDYTVSWTALVYVVVLTLLASIITGIIPALQATGRRVQFNLSQFHSHSGLRLGRTWTALIVVEVSVACAAIPIAVGLGLLQVRDFFRVPSFPVEQILFARVALQRTEGLRPAEFANVQAELSRKLDAEPGIVGHSFTLDLPGVGVEARVAMDHDDHAGSGDRAPVGRSVQQSTVDPNFFQTFDMNLLAGRAFDAGDRGPNAADVVIVNRAFVRKALGDRDPLGRRLRYVPASQPERDDPVKARWYEIVGVVGDIDKNPFGQDLVDACVYHPMKHVERTRAAVAVRVTGVDQGSLARRLARVAVGIDPALELDVVPLAEDYRLRRKLLTTAAAGIAAGVLSVLLLSAAGVYALMSFTVAQRRREIAIRLALGAQPRRLLGGVFGQALRQVAIGVAIGVGLALLIDATSDGAALRGKGGLLLSMMVVLMSGVGLLAALGPARRGLRIEPAEALKSE